MPVVQAPALHAQPVPPTGHMSGRQVPAWQLSVFPCWPTPHCPATHGQPSAPGLQVNRSHMERVLQRRPAPVHMAPAAHEQPSPPGVHEDGWQVPPVQAITWPPSSLAQLLEAVQAHPALPGVHMLMWQVPFTQLDPALHRLLSHGHPAVPAGQTAGATGGVAVGCGQPDSSAAPIATQRANQMERVMGVSFTADAGSLVLRD